MHATIFCEECRSEQHSEQRGEQRREQRGAGTDCLRHCGFRDARDFVKLHSELADPTELQLDGLGVDFVFQCHKNNKNKKNPHLASTALHV